MHNTKKYQLALVSLFFLALVSGCAATIPKEALQLSNESLEDRRMQTRRYDGATDTEILSASAGVLQDLGFQIDESETKLGVIVSSKERDATEAGQVAAAIFIAALGGGSVPIDNRQKIRACLVIKPVAGDSTEVHNVRITFQRLVWNTQNQLSKAEGLRDPEMYQEFFEKLSKSIFLEANEI